MVLREGGKARRKFQQGRSNRAGVSLMGTMEVLSTVAFLVRAVEVVEREVVEVCVVGMGQMVG